MRWKEQRIILANPHILSKSHVTRDIHAREIQMKEIGLRLGPTTEDRNPVNCWLHGKPRTGQTAAARRPAANVTTIARFLGKLLLF